MPAVFSHFGILGDFIRAEVQSVGADQLVTDAVHLPLHRKADGFAVQVGVKTPPDPVLFQHGHDLGGVGPGVHRRVVEKDQLLPARPGSAASRLSRSRPISRFITFSSWGSSASKSHPRVPHRAYPSTV